MAVRILRLIEYIYPDNKTAEKDMAKWCVPAIGNKLIGDKSIRSTVLTDLTFEKEDFSE